MDIRSLQTLVDNLDAVILAADIKSCEIMYANLSARKMFGEVTGKICWQALQNGLSGPCLLRGCKSTSGETSGHENSVKYEMQHSASGRWYEINVRAVEIPENRTVCLHFARDITDRKVMGAALHNSEEKYRLVADHTYDWECWIREDKRFEYNSPSCERITGYRAEEFIADPGLLRRIIHRDDRILFAAHEREAFRSGEYGHLDFRIITRSGEERWISHYCQPVYGRDGAFLGRRVSNRDITSRVEAERKTRLNEQRLKTQVKLYENRELPTEEICEFVLESSLTLTLSSLGFMGFLDDNEIMMKIQTWSRSVLDEYRHDPGHPEINVWQTGILGEAVRRRRPVMVNEFSAFSSGHKALPEGHSKITRFLAVPLLFDGKAVAVLAVANKESDYTGEDVDQLYLLLEGMWQVLLKKRAEEDSARQTAKIRQLVNAVSHDLKSPAVSVQGFAGLLKEKYSDILDRKGLKYCDHIVKAAEQITALSEDINTYIASKDNGFDFEVLELPELWNSVRQEFLPQLKKRKIRWSVPELETPEIKGHRMGLLRVFRNLVDNALKYGGVEMTEIAMGYESTADYHILTVKNNGEIILPGDERIIFEEFARKTSNPRIYGTGLGLAIVREIARKHQGSAWLTSCESRKPVFCISISRHL